MLQRKRTANEAFVDKEISEDVAESVETEEDVLVVIVEEANKEVEENE